MLERPQFIHRVYLMIRDAHSALGAPTVAHIAGCLGETNERIGAALAELIHLGDVVEVRRAGIDRTFALASLYRLAA